MWSDHCNTIKAREHEEMHALCVGIQFITLLNFLYPPVDNQLLLLLLSVMGLLRDYLVLNMSIPMEFDIIIIEQSNMTHPPKS